MTANKDFAKAETIGVFVPFVHLLCKSAKFKRCDYCFVSCDDLKSCTGCLHMKYCCKSCQKNDWKHHKHECALMKGGRAIEVDDYVLMLYRLHQYSQSEKGSKVKQEILGKVRMYSDLMSHVDDIKQNEKMMSNFMKMAVEVKKFFGNSSSELAKPNMLLETFGKMIVNSYSILDEDLNNIGIGFYLGPSIIDHSCQPNCVISFNGISMNVRCLKYVCSGENLYMSYVDLMDSREQRRTKLMETYFFECNCEVCLNDEMDYNMLAFNEVSLENDLEHLVADDIAKVKNLFDQIKRERLNSETANESYHLVREHDGFISKLSTKWMNKFQPFNIYLFKLLEHCFESSIELERWSEVCNYGEKLIPIYEFYLKDPNPNFGHFLVKLGKVYLYLNECLEALKCLEKADDVLSVTHSPENVLYSSLQSLLEQCRKELSIV